MIYQKRKENRAMMARTMEPTRTVVSFKWRNKESIPYENTILSAKRIIQSLPHYINRIKNKPLNNVRQRRWRRGGGNIGMSQYWRTEISIDYFNAKSLNLLPIPPLLSLPPRGVELARLRSLFLFLPTALPATLPTMLSIKFFLTPPVRRTSPPTACVATRLPTTAYFR